MADRLRRCCRRGRGQTRRSRSGWYSGQRRGSCSTSAPAATAASNHARTAARSLGGRRRAISRFGTSSARRARARTSAVRPRRSRRRRRSASPARRRASGARRRRRRCSRTNRDTEWRGDRARADRNVGSLGEHARTSTRTFPRSEGGPRDRGSTGQAGAGTAIRETSSTASTTKAPAARRLRVGGRVGVAGVEITGASRGVRPVRRLDRRGEARARDGASGASRGSETDVSTCDSVRIDLLAASGPAVPRRDRHPHPVTPSTSPTCGTPWRANESLGFTVVSRSSASPCPRWVTGRSGTRFLSHRLIRWRTAWAMRSPRASWRKWLASSYSSQVELGDRAVVTAGPRCGKTSSASPTKGPDRRRVEAGEVGASARRRCLGRGVHGDGEGEGRGPVTPDSPSPVNGASWRRGPLLISGR